MSSDFGLRFFLFVWLCTWARVVLSFPGKSRNEAKVASEGDVNVLMFGVLQFSESLHQMSQNTQDKLARIADAISHTESLVQRLDQDTEQAVQFERQTKERLSLIQAQMTALQIQAEQTKGLVNKVEQENVELKQKVTNLEANLNNFTLDGIRALKETTLKHNTLLDDLINWREKQKKQLEEQKQQLAKLQKQTKASD